MNALPGLNKCLLSDRFIRAGLGTTSVDAGVKLFCSSSLAGSVTVEAVVTGVVRADCQSWGRCV